MHRSRNIVAAAALVLAGCGSYIHLPDYRLCVREAESATSIRYLDMLTWRVSDLLWRGDGWDDERIARALGSQCADTRLAAAVALATSGHENAVARLTGFLVDPDLGVRRVAAECLYGGRMRIDALARAYGFEPVLEAEAQTRRLAERVRRGTGPEQYEATRALVALGRSAVWALHLLSHDPDEAVSLSAIYALQEITAVDTEVKPSWAARGQAALDGTVTVEQGGFACGVVPYWIDVRDLEVAGVRRDWAAELNRNAFPGDEWIGIPEMGTSLENHDGLLMLMVPTCRQHEPDAGREKLGPVYAYLDGLRTRLRPSLGQ